MYNTVTEIHTAIILGLQQVNNNRLRNLESPQLDLIFNRVMYKYIDSRIKEDGQAVTKYKDLQELYVDYSTRLIKLSSRESYINLPYTYKDFIKGSLDLYHNCNKVVTGEEETSITRYFQFKLIDTSGLNGVYFKDFKITAITNTNTSITLFDIAQYTKLESFQSDDAKFMLLHILEQAFLNSDFEYKYEIFDGYIQENIILIDKYKKYKSITVSFKNVFTTYLYTDKILTHNKVTTNLTKPLDLSLDNDTIDYSNNYYYNKNRHENPIGVIKNNNLNIYNTDTFIPATCKITYLSKPRLMNSFTNTMPSLISKLEDLVDLTIQECMIYLSNNLEATLLNNKNI